LSSSIKGSRKQTKAGKSVLKDLEIRVDPVEEMEERLRECPFFKRP
jgi:hypothetical protein